MLLDWSNDLASGGSSDARIATCQLTIFRFLVWAERSGIFRYRVQIYDREKLPPGMENYKFPVGTDVALKQTKSGTYSRYTWTYQRALHRGAIGFRHTPNEGEVRAIHDVAFRSPLGERDTLIYSWAEFAGLRISEVLRVCRSQMPGGVELDELLDRGGAATIGILGKGNRIRNVIVPMSLVLMTLTYIEGSRAELVKRLRARSSSYLEPDEVILSNRTGLPLEPNSVSHRAAVTFRAAGVTNAGAHRLRARFAIDLIEAHLDAIQNADSRLSSEVTAASTILFKVADLMGHTNIHSLRPYLNHALNRRLIVTPGFQITQARSKVQALERLEDSLLRKTFAYNSLKEVLVALEESGPKRAADLLRTLADSLVGINQYGPSSLV